MRPGLRSSKAAQRREPDQLLDSRRRPWWGLAHMDTCVFCGMLGDDFKPEHWVSQWISRASIPEGKGVEHHVPGREPWLDRTVDLTVEHICPDCNHHWMSDMEGRTRNLALPLIEGDTTPRTFGAPEVTRLAAWCFMKAITLELGRPADQARTYSDGFYSGFRKHKRPPHGCLVSIGFREIPEDPEMFVWFKSEGRTHHAVPGIGDLAGYRTALAIRHLVIDVIGIIAAAPIQVSDRDNRLVQIWPNVPSLDWPPPQRFAGIVNDDLA
jgi:hypothetical protein